MLCTEVFPPKIIDMCQVVALYNRFLYNSSHVSLHCKMYLVLSHHRNTKNMFNELVYPSSFT